MGGKATGIVAPPKARKPRAPRAALPLKACADCAVKSDLLKYEREDRESTERYRNARTTRHEYALAGVAAVGAAGLSFYWLREAIRIVRNIL